MGDVAKVVSRRSRAHTLLNTVCVSRVDNLIDALHAFGADVPRIVERAGLDERHLSRERERAPIEELAEIWKSALEISGRDDLGLRLAPKFRKGALGLVEHAAMTSATTADLLFTVERFCKLADNRAVVRVHVAGDEVLVTASRSSNYALPAAELQCQLARIADLLFEIFGQNVTAVKLKLPGGRAAVFEAQRLDHMLLRAESGTVQLTFPKRLLDVGIPSSDPLLHRILVERAQRDLANLALGFIDYVRATLMLIIERGGNLDLSCLAAEMSVGVRTLRRRLDEHDTMFKTLLAEVRLECARLDLLQSSRSMDELALKLGFSSASAFYKAFKRWTGMTPAAYRARLCATMIDAQCSTSSTAESAPHAR
jgi:AraC-like DNA-binding protein